jgi:hypothetical protein
MIHTATDFYNKVATELRASYFPNENHGITENKQYWKTTRTLELFNNGSLTYRQLVNRLSKSCKTTTEKMHSIVSKYVISFGQYKYKPNKHYVAVAINKEYWVCISKPCSKKATLLFKDCVMKGEVFAIKTEKEVNDYKFVIK